MTTDDFTTAARAEAERLVAASPTGHVFPTPLGVHMAEWARTYLAEQEPDHTIEAVTITALASRHYVEDEETGASRLHPVYGNRSSIEIMLPEGASLPRLTLGGEWTITLARAVGRDAR